jgi:hypothetical protein
LGVRAGLVLGVAVLGVRAGLAGGWCLVVAVEAVQLDAQPDQALRGADVDVAGDDGDRIASQATARAGGPASQAPPSLPVTDAAARRAAHRTAAARVHSACRTDPPSIARSSARVMWTRALTGCPARSGSSPAAVRRRMRWSRFRIMMDVWTQHRKTGRKPSSGRVCTPA